MTDVVVVTTDAEDVWVVDLSTPEEVVVRVSQGIQGDQGIQGEQGIQGDVGPQGAMDAEDVLDTIDTATTTPSTTISWVVDPGTVSILAEIIAGSIKAAHVDTAEVPSVATMTTAIQAAIDALVDASPGTLDTLNELAAALGDDPNFATTVAATIAAAQADADAAQVDADAAQATADAALPKAGGTMTGTITMGGQQITGAVLDGYEETIDARGTVTTAQAIDGEKSIVRMTLGANLTITAGLAAGESVYLKLTQDGTGSRIVTWSGVTWADGAPPTLSTAIGAKDVICLVHDGDAIVGFLGGLAFA